MIRLSQTQQSVLAAAVRQTATSHDALEALRLLYGRLQAEIDRRRPVCQVSGRCCHFEQFGHRLFVTTLELAAFLDDLPQDARSLPVVADGCRFQAAGRCSVHAVRPFGCRIFFCDPTAAEWQRQQYETFHAEIRRLHETFDVPYFYVEWREALAAMNESGTGILPVFSERREPPDFHIAR